MKDMLYHDDIENYNNSLLKGREYEISNDGINYARKPLTRESCSKYLMTISSQTVVQAMDSGPSSSEISPVYCPIAAIPCHIFTEQYDVVAVVLYVGFPKTVTGIHGSPISVCELVVTDSNIEGTLVISAWNDLVATVQDKLGPIIQSTPVIGLTYLKSSAYKARRVIQEPILMPRSPRITPLLW